MILTTTLIIAYLIVGTFFAAAATGLYESKTDQSWTSDTFVTYGVIIFPLFWPLVLLALPVIILAAPFMGVAKLGSYVSKELINPKTNV